MSPPADSVVFLHKCSVKNILFQIRIIISICASHLILFFLPAKEYLLKSKNEIFVLEKMMVVLRDNRTLIGYLRSIDQFGNLALHQTIERIYVGSKYGDIPRGIFIVRGENAVLLGELVSQEQNYKGGF